jgi:hypothetical protein
MARRLPATRPDRFVHPLSVVRAAKNWTYQDVVDVIARRHRNMAARREKAWKWEHWGVVPDLDSQLALAAELGVPEDQTAPRGAVMYPSHSGERLEEMSLDLMARPGLERE